MKQRRIFSREFKLAAVKKIQSVCAYRRYSAEY
jgi:hypothetical protein